MNIKTKNGQYIIRKATVEDLYKMLEIEKEAFGKHHWSYQAFESELNNQYSTYFICLDVLDEKGVVGYIVYWKVLDEGHITTIAVSSNYRRKHLADILLYKIIQDAIKKNIKWLTLEVRNSNQSAINLYKKFQFLQLGIRKGYYQDNNEDALILWTNKISSDEYNNHIHGILEKILLADKSQ